MTNLYLTSAAADAAVTVGSDTKWKAGWSAGASATHTNKESVVGLTPPHQATDGAAGVDGTPVSWYTEPLQAVTIVGQVVCSLWCRENANNNNVAPTVRIERCSGDGTVLSTIVDETVDHGAGEMATTAGGASDTVTLTAVNVVDTALSGGDRLRITLWIDDAVDQGGAGTMSASGRGEFWVNGPTGSQGQAQLAFTETIAPVPPAPTGDVLYVDSTTTGNTALTSSRAAPVPVGATTADVVVVRLGRWESSNPAVTAPSGFVQLTQVAAGNQKSDTFVKRLTGNDTGTYTFSWTGSMWTSAHAVLYRGVDRDIDLSTLPLNQATNSGSAFPNTTLNGVGEGSALDWHGCTGSSGTHTPPTGWTEVEDNDCGVTAYQESVAAGNFSASGATSSVSGDQTASLLELPAEPAAGGGSVSGTGVAALGGLTATATGTRTVTGAAVSALGAATATATGAVSKAGTAVATLGALTASGTATGGVSGTGAAALGGLTAAATGVRTVHGAAVSTLGALAATASGTTSGETSAAAQLGGLTATATGLREVLGAFLAPLGGLAATAAGTRATTGAAVAPLGTLAAAATGTRATTGAAVAVLGSLTASVVQAGAFTPALRPTVTVRAEATATTRELQATATTRANATATTRET